MVLKYGVGMTHTMSLHAASRFTWEQLVQWRKNSTLDMTQDIVNKGFHIIFACAQLAACLAKEKT